jgi:exocyst complex component 5
LFYGGYQIQQYLELLLNKASNLSQLSFLRMLHLAHLQTSSLVEFLKTFDLSNVASRSGSERAVTDALMASSAVPGGAGQVVPMSVMLETAIDELFMPFTEGQKYLERESKNLGELYSSYLYRFTRYHVSSYLTTPRNASRLGTVIQESVSKSKTSNLLNRVVNQINAAASNTASTAGSTTTTAQAAAAFMKFSGLGSAADREKEKSGEEPVCEEDGRLSVDVSEKMLKWHAEAVGRCVELSSTSDV